MELTLYRTTADKRVVNKTLTNSTVFNNVTCHDMKNYLTPTFRLSTDADIKVFNYVYCPHFGRYYFIENVEYSTTGLYILSCRVDVLKTYETQIKNLTATVKRNENLANAYLLDNNYKSVAYSEIVTKEFPFAINNDSLVLLTVG